ncbi:hypothetical protein PRIPAC_78113 [Pristionchus pacificus]|uniref:Uncharacterized protein n=1 Tax=Pristionchus pacificus TaxID=54126 RepID=A0A454Y3U2_PRIPA|nr:hypothetical protein PRIPAC_78113 [Pristionchus pacificus]|eukprot:PDM78774.1 hypothetical protein PRIPAC_31353 [Pristionchus pacificus]
MTSDVNVERRVATSLMSPSLLCLLLLTITIDAAPAPDVVSDLAGTVRGLSRTAGGMVKSLPIVGGLASPFVDGAQGFVDSASKGFGK